MRKLTIVISLLSILIVAPSVASAQSFLFGLGAGLLLGGNSQYGSGGATILYAADEETLKTVNPMSVRMGANYGCFWKDSTAHWKRTGKSLGDLFAELTAKMPKKQRTVLQVARVFDAGSPECAAIWFAYIEK